MKKTKKILALCMVVVMMAGLATVAFASGGTEMNLKSKEGYLNDCISVSNVVKTDDSEKYIEDATIYICDSPAQIKTLGVVSALSIYKMEVVDGIWTRVEEVPISGQVTIWDAVTGEELTIDYEDMDSYETDGPPDILEGAKATLTEKGVYSVYCIVAPLSDYIEAVVVVEGESTTPATVQVNPTSSEVLVNGETTAFDSYNIGGNNFFKLRDLAYALNGSDKQFQVKWDGENNAIMLISGESYIPVGGEMEGKGTEARTAAPTTSKIIMDGSEINLTAYRIDGNNYFKLRDIGQAFDFGVDWDGMTNTVSINTADGYSE